MRRLAAPFGTALAAYVGCVTLLVGAISTYWDIATHIDVGRERFLTPAHIGLYVSVLVGAITLMLSGLADHFRAGDSLTAALRHPFREIRPGIAVAGAGFLTTLAAAPLDNAWHEVYGLDVTIWSPPHLLAIFGIAAATLGLAALIAPAAGYQNNSFYPMLLAGFLTTLIVTTGEYDFNAPQYRIAYHPFILGAIGALVFTAAAGQRWRATKVALWFELVRVASLVFLLAIGRSLPFVPVLVPAALAADLIPRDRARGVVSGVVVAALVVLTNWVTLEALPGLRWPLDDLALGAAAALLAGGVMGRVGWHLGVRLDGRQADRSQRIRPQTAVLTLFVLFLATASPAIAHEVGARRGGGVIEWTPGIPEAGQPVRVEISQLELSSGSTPADLRIEAWRAEQRITVPIRNDTARIVLPEQGLWFLFVRGRADGESLLWGDHFTVADEGAGAAGAARQRFTLGVDTLDMDEPPAWVDVLAHGIAILIAVGLLMAVIRALDRLPDGVQPGAVPS